MNIVLITLGVLGIVAVAVGTVLRVKSDKKDVKRKRLGLGLIISGAAVVALVPLIYVALRYNQREKIRRGLARKALKR